MARIRTIKPDFWRDEKIANLKNKNAALLFIALWNVADDEGKFPFSAKSLQLQIPIFRAKDINSYLEMLIESQLIQQSDCENWGLVVNWHHQRIDKPQPAKIKKEEIQWLALGHSKNVRGRSKNIPRKDRIGKDRKGRDRIVAREPEFDEFENAPNPVEPVGDQPPRAVAPKAPTQAFIALYCDKWRQRYKLNQSPPITGKDAGIARRLTKNLPIDRLELLLAAFFVMPDAHLVKAKHPLELFEMKMKEIAVFAESGQFTTRSEANQFDKLAQNEMVLMKLERGEL